MRWGIYCCRLAKAQNGLLAPLSMCKRLKPSNSPSGGCSRAHWWPEEGLATVPRGAELCFAQPSASSSCANTMGCSLSPSVFASPGSSRKDGCSRGLRLKGLPGKGFIFISQFLSVLKCNKTATPGCKLFLSSDLFLISSLVLCQSPFAPPAFGSSLP